MNKQLLGECVVEHYPKEIGIVALEDGTYDVDVHTPRLPPNTVYVREDVENPWRYPSRGELPETDGFYLVSTEGPLTEICYWDGRKWQGKGWEESEVRAWRILPEPAPEIEEEQ